MKEIKDLKQMKLRLKKYEEEVVVLKENVSKINKEYTGKVNGIRKLRQSISELEKGANIRISEHAILRYLERVKGIDLSVIQKEMINESVVGIVNTLGGTGKFPNKNFKLVMDNYTVVTVTV